MSRQLSSWRDGLTARLGKKVPHDSTSLVNEKTREPQEKMCDVLMRISRFDGAQQGGHGHNAPRAVFV
jgi:hypothetical protein